MILEVANGLNECGSQSSELKCRVGQLLWLMMEAVFPFETVIANFKTAQCHIPEECILSTDHLENLKIYILYTAHAVCIMFLAEAY